MTAAAHPTRVALFALLGLALAIAVLIGFGARAWHQRVRYAVAVTGTVYGLEPGGDVYFEGVRVGTVKALHISTARVGQVDVAIEIDRDTPVQQDTRAYLTFAGVTGVKEIDLRVGAGPSPPLPPGGTIPVGETGLDQLEKVASAVGAHAGHLVDQLDRTAQNLAALTQPDQLGAVVARTRDAADELAGASRELHAMIGENRAALRDSLAAIDRTAQSAAELLSGRASELVTRADDVVARLDRVVRDNAGQLHAAMLELHEASRSFEELSRELRESPSLLLFSRPERGRR